MAKTMSAAQGRKRGYEPPVVELLSVRVEKGFSGSNSDSSTAPEQIGSSGYEYVID